MTTDPCRICGSAVRHVTKDLPLRNGETKARAFEDRVCTKPSCRTNTSARGMADKV